MSLLLLLHEYQIKKTKKLISCGEHLQIKIVFIKYNIWLILNKYMYIYYYYYKKVAAKKVYFISIFRSDFCNLMESLFNSTQMSFSPVSHFLVCAVEL